MSSLTGSGASAMNNNTSPPLSGSIKPGSSPGEAGQNNTLASSAQISTSTINSNANSSLSESIKSRPPGGAGQNNSLNSAINDHQQMKMNSPPSNEGNNTGNIERKEATEMRAKKDKQAKRGAIIRNNMKGKSS